MPRAQSDAIDEVLMAEVSARGGGAAVAITRHGERSFANGYGHANVEWEAPVTPDTIFPIASLSKPLTALAVMTLVEEGRLALGDAIDRYLPPLRNARAPITIEHLLTHTSGIRNLNDVFTPADRRRAISAQDLLAEIVQFPCDFKPLERWTYSNTGYVLLSYIVETVTGLSFGQFMRRRLFEPLGMTRSSLLHERAILPGRASDYRAGPHGIERAEFESFTWYRGSGALASTVADLARLEAGIFGNRILSERLFARMVEPVRLADGSTYPYGLGWGVADYFGHGVHHHTGGIQGFRGEYLRLPDDGLAVMVLANHADFPFHKVTCALTRRLLDLPETKREAASMSADDRQLVTGDFAPVGGGPGLTIRDEGGRLRCASANISELALDGDGRLYDVQDPEVTLQLERDAAGRVISVTMAVPMFASQRFDRTPEVSTGSGAK